MDKPFTFIALALILGILFSYFFDVGIVIVFLGISLIFLFFIANIRFRKSNNLNIFILFLLIGILITQVNKSSKLSKMVGERNDYIGRVEEIKKQSDSEATYIVLVEKQNNNIINEKIILKTIGNKLLNLGDSFQFNGVLNLPLENTNPLLYNHKLNLLSNKIYTTMTIKDFSISNIIKNKSLKYKLRIGFRNDVENLFKTHLNEKNSNLITSIILGKSTYLEEEDLLKYRDLGLAHILAVSGLHIGIISGFLLFLISRIGIKRNINYIITLGTIWFYGFLIGFSPSTLRAVIMFSILFYSTSIHEPYDSLNTIFSAMLILLLINPFWLFNISFQLSFIATISIIVLTPKIVSKFYPYKSKTITTLGGIMGVNLGLLPIQAYYFNKISLLGIIANLITIPILSLTLILGMIMIILNYIFPAFNTLLGIILNLLLNFEMFISNVLYNFPINIIKVFSPDIFCIIIYYLILGLVFNFIDLSKFDLKLRKLIIFYLLILILINSIMISLDNNTLEIHFIDVGQGDSILIKVGDKNYLIDTGGSIFDGYDITKNITLPYLQKHGIFKLDSLFISHFDEDHSKGLEILFENMKINNIYSSYVTDDKAYLPFIILRKGNIIKIDKNTAFYVLWPDTDTNPNLSSNNKSLVLLLKHKDYSILFTGDIEKEVEVQAIEGLNSHIDILKVAHHGSNTSTSEGFIDRTMPKNSIISVGRNNFYNHPNNEVIERLSNIDSTIYRTDKMGLIKVVINKEDVEIIPYLNKNTSFSIFLEKNLYFVIFYIFYFILSYFLITMYKRTVEELGSFEL